MSPDDFAAWQLHKAAVAASQHELSVLTPRQRDLTRLICQGFTQHQAATRLGVSKRVAEQESAAIRAATGLTQCELVVQATRAGWV